MKTATVNIDGEEWKLDDNPLMGTVRYVQQMQMEMLQDNISEDKMKSLVEGSEDDEIPEDELMQAMIEDKGMSGIADIMWDQSLIGDIQLICLASDRKLTSKKVDDMPSRDFMELKSKSRKILGGSAEDFLKELGIDTSSMLNEQEMEDQLPNA